MRAIFAVLLSICAVPTLSYAADDKIEIKGVSQEQLKKMAEMESKHADEAKAEAEAQKKLAQQKRGAKESKETVK